MRGVTTDERRPTGTTLALAVVFPLVSFVWTTETERETNR